MKKAPKPLYRRPIKIMLFLALTIVLSAAHSTPNDTATPIMIKANDFEVLLKRAETLVENKKSAHIVITQFKAYIRQKTLQSQKKMSNKVDPINPKIAHPIIKSIPITESNEPLIDIIEAKHPRIKMLPQPKIPFESPDHHSGFECASKVRLSVFNQLKKMLSQLDKLAPHFGYKSGQLTIKVFEGLRDLNVQEQLFNEQQEKIRKANPRMSDEDVFQEASKWVSPVVNNVPAHSTGAAVDIRLWDNFTHQFLDMGPFGVIWTLNSSAPTFSEGLTETQMKNRVLMLTAASQAGFINYTYEWWHYSSGDRYASYWQEAVPEKRHARFGSIALPNN